MPLGLVTPTVIDRNGLKSLNKESQDKKNKMQQCLKKGIKMFTWNHTIRHLDTGESGMIIKLQNSISRMLTFLTILLSCLYFLIILSIALYALHLGISLLSLINKIRRLTKDHVHYVILLIASLWKLLTVWTSDFRLKFIIYIDTRNLNCLVLWGVCVCVSENIYVFVSAIVDEC